MKTETLLALLEEHKEKRLIFEYLPGKNVPPHYHITEVKNMTIESVDCGARPDAWKETVIQLWETDQEIGKTDYMSAYKALGILKKVDKMRAMDRDAEVKFEYGNASFHTAQLFVDDLLWNTKDIIVKLAITKTDCKAKDSCGIAVEDTTTAQTSCSPGSGCC